jgi:hypothetical protein
MLPLKSTNFGNSLGSLIHSGYELVPNQQSESSDDDLGPDQLRAMEIIKNKRVSNPATNWEQMSYAIKTDPKFAIQFVKEYDECGCCAIL